MLDKQERRKVLSGGRAPDQYLNDVAARFETHRFLGGATQGCYLRSVDLLVAIFAQRGRSPSDVRVLDWGAGKGHITYLLKKAGFVVASCDIRSGLDDSSFAQATPILDENGLAVTPLDHPWILPFANAQFDLVLSIGVLEHVAHEAGSLAELRRVLKPDGLFFFSFLPYWLSWTQRLAHLRGDHYHDRLYSASRLRTLLTEAGFSIESLWHGQLLPKNGASYSDRAERIDRWLTEWTPLRYLATNLEGVCSLSADPPQAQGRP